MTGRMLEGRGVHRVTLTPQCVEGEWGAFVSGKWLPLPGVFDRRDMYVVICRTGLDAVSEA